MNKCENLDNLIYLTNIKRMEAISLFHNFHVVLLRLLLIFYIKESS